MLSTRIETLALSFAELVLAGNGRKHFSSIMEFIVSVSLGNTECGRGALAGRKRRSISWDHETMSASGTKAGTAAECDTKRENAGRGRGLAQEYMIS